jgi:hypothetical protein
MHALACAAIVIPSLTGPTLFLEACTYCDKLCVWLLCVCIFALQSFQYWQVRRIIRSISHIYSVVQVILNKIRRKLWNCSIYWFHPHVCCPRNLTHLVDFMSANHISLRQKRDIGMATTGRGLCNILCSWKSKTIKKVLLSLPLFFSDRTLTKI